jgi:hypothetical protein
VCYVIEHQPRLANMAKFLALNLGGCARGFLGEEAALGVRPRCVQAPDEVAISLKSVNVRLKNDYKWKCRLESEVIDPNVPTCVGHCPQVLGIEFVQTMGFTYLKE